MTVPKAQIQKIKRSLRHSIFDGAAYSAMLGLTQDYITPFALALKASATEIGLLASLPNLTMALSQLTAPHLAEKAGSRKKLILPVIFLHALMFLPILLIPFLPVAHKVWWLIGFFVLSTVFGSLGNPAWGSMMADLVPEEARGRYFGIRGRICGIFTLAFFIIGGIILQYSKTNVFIGFSILFGGALFFRLASGYFLSRMYEPPIIAVKKEHISTFEIARHIGSSNLGRFTLYISLISFATQISGPFFAVHMLRDLEFNYATYVIVLATASISTFIFLTFWGRRADKAGNIRVLKISSFLVPLVPILWLGGHQIYYLLIVQAISGFAWAGFNLASTNFVYDASRPEERTRYIAVFNAMNGIANCLGALLGGILAPRLPSLLGYPLLTLFLISGIARGMVAVFLLRRIKEVRHVPSVGTLPLLFGRLSPVHVRANSAIHSVPSQALVTTVIPAEHNERIVELKQGETPVSEESQKELVSLPDTGQKSA